MKTHNLSAVELVYAAKDGLRVAEQCLDAVASPGVREEFARPLLHEAVDAIRVANAALVELKQRASGVRPPKVGD